MSISEPELISEDSLQIESSKIVKHEAKLGELELSLVRSEDSDLVYINIHVNGENEDLQLLHSGWRGTAKNLGKLSDEEAKKEYAKVIDKITKGDYNLHLYDDGKAQIEFIS